MPDPARTTDRICLPSGYSLCAYEVADLEAVVQLITESIHSLGATYYTPAQCHAWAPLESDPEDWRPRLNAGHAHLVHHQEALAGLISFHPDTGIDLLFVGPAHARRGIGSALVRYAENCLWHAGCSRIHTYASLAARPLFERHGFTVDKTEIVRRGKETLTRFAMYKQRPPAL